MLVYLRITERVISLSVDRFFISGTRHMTVRSLGYEAFMPLNPAVRTNGRRINRRAAPSLQFNKTAKLKRPVQLILSVTIPVPLFVQYRFQVMHRPDSRSGPSDQDDTIEGLNR